MDQAPLEGFGGAGTGTLSAVPGGFGHSPAKRLRCTIFSLLLRVSVFCVTYFFKAYFQGLVGMHISTWHYIPGTMFVNVPEVRV